METHVAKYLYPIVISFLFCSAFGESCGDSYRFRAVFPFDSFDSKVSFWKRKPSFLLCSAFGNLLSSYKSAMFIIIKRVKPTFVKVLLCKFFV